MQTPPPNKHVWTYQGYQLEPGNFTTAMVHLYRAEVTRTNLWRNRLDTTTNWAVVTAAAALTFVFSAPANPHFVLLLVQVLMLTFLFIEARRYRYYQLWYHRVRILETDFFATMMAPPYRPPDEWAQALSDSLVTPRFMMSRWRAVGLRLRRIYIWIFSVMMISWTFKLAVHPDSTTSLAALVQRASIGMMLPGVLVVSIAALGYLALLVLMFFSLSTKTQIGQEGHQPTEYRTPRDTRRIEPKQLALIITKEKQAVSQRLMQELQRGVTAIPATGMYTGESRDVLLCAHTRNQSKLLHELVHKADPTAFVVITAATGIQGHGFNFTEPPD